MLGKHARIKVCRAVGDTDPEYGFTYPLNYGMAVGGNIDLSERKIGAFILGITHPVREFDGRIIGVLTKKTGEKILVVAPKSKHLINHEIEEQIGFLKQYFSYKLDCYYERSCGAIVFRKVDGVVRYLLIKNRRSTHWSFPKGHIEENETPEQAAVREVWEETGIRIALDAAFSRTVESPLSRDRRTVTFYLGTSLEGLKEPRAAEVKEALWLPFDEALAAIRYQPDRDILLQAAAYLKAKENRS